jgi:ABC-type branched-subunit amino acid transport system ATPase component/ABC-type branched-subunit amino acid transport system permease subunit
LTTAVERADRFLRHPDVRFGQKVALATLALLVFFGVVFPAPPAILFLGAVLGSISALIAVGMVLIYRANRVINFAQGDLGAVASILGVSLIVGRHWSFFPAFAVGLVAAVLLGGAVEFLIIRRFAKAPRLILTVVTIGVALLCQAGELGIPKLFGYDVAPQSFPRPFDFTLHWQPVVFRGSHLFAFLLVPLVAGGVGLFLRKARFGKAMRAAAESADRALLLGIPVRVVNTVVWMGAAGLSALASELRTPLVGVSIGTPLGPALLLRALAAAVIARMESLPIAFASAIGLGMVEQAVLWDRGNTYVIDGVLFFVIMGALLLQRRSGSSRAEDRQTSSWSVVREVRPIPPELRDVPEVRWGLRLVSGLVVAILVVVPAFLDVAKANLFGTFVIYAMVGASLLVLTGWAGQISLGQMAFVGLGAAVAGVLFQHHWSFFPTLLVAGLAGVIVSVVVGIPALRVRGPFLAVATFALALSANSFFLNQQLFPWLVPKFSPRVVRPLLFGKFDLETEHAEYWFLLVVLALVFLSVRAVRASRTGRVLIAARDNDRATQSYGVNVTRARLVAFAYSGFLAAFAGALFVYQQHGLSRSSFRPEESLNVFAMAVFGGLGSLPGVIAGAAWFTLLTYAFHVQALQLLSTGVGLLVVLMFVPGGLTQLIYGLRDWLLRIVARRRGIVVPSLLADEADDPQADADERARRAVAAVPPGLDDILTVRGLDVAYGQTQVLFGVDLSVARGELLALLGTNGAGKSTLLNAVCGLVAPSAGTVVFDGGEITGLGANRTAGLGLIMVPGGKGVFPSLTVAENLELAGWLYQGDRQYLAAARAEVLGYFPILEERWQEEAGNLSGGEQQMLTLGQAFIAKPKLLLIDELSLGLAPIVVEQLLEIVKAIHARGTTVVLVEQSVNVAITLAQRACFMEKGEVRFDGPTAELLERPEILRAVFLQGAGTMNGTGNGNGSATSMTVRERTPFLAHCDTCGRENGIALETRGVSVSFGGIRAVRDVDLEVREGQVVGLIGHNGAGKTTLMDLISGYLRPASGRIFLGGDDVTELSPDLRAAAGLGRSFQDARLFPAMTVHETLAVALERRVPVKDPLAAALASPATRMAERWVDEQVGELVDLLNLGAFANKFISELSTGTRRIVDLGCALAHQPSVLLLDEPSSGIAQRETEALGPVLLDIRDRTGAALLVIEHDMPLITAISDELVALDLGAVIARGEPSAVVSDPHVVASYLGSTDDVINRSGARVATTRRSRRRGKQ